MPTSPHMSSFRRLLSWYYRFLCALLVISILILVLPVTLQIFARFTPWLPRYIWTEEMARFLFIWTIMIGSIVGVREGTHFNVDMWPRLPPQADAALRLIASGSDPRHRPRLSLAGRAVHRLRLVPDLGTRGTAALADLHRLADRRRLLDPVSGRADPRRSAHPVREELHDRLRPLRRPGLLDPVRHLLRGTVPADTGGVRAGSRHPADPDDRAAPVLDDAAPGDVQLLQLIHPAGGPVLSPGRQPDERRRHHRTADAPVARHGRPFPR